MSYITNPHPHLAEMSAMNPEQPKVDFLAWYNDGYVVNGAHLLENPAHPERIGWNLLPEATSQPHIIPRLGITHTQGGMNKASNEGLRNWMLNASNLEPHMCGPEMDDGSMLQVIPFNIRADVSGPANRFILLSGGPYYGAITCEAQDLGARTANVNNTPFTDEQVRSLVGLWTACCATYRMSCQLIAKDAAPVRWTGLSWHANVASWSSSGHGCPGAARIAQMPWIAHEVATRLAYIYEAFGEGCP